MLMEVKYQEKEYRSNEYDDPLEHVLQTNSRVRNIQLTSMVGLPTPVINQTHCVYQ